MKTLVLFFALLLTSTTVFATESATTPSAAASVNRYIETTIREAIHLPEVLKTTTGQQRLLVVFTIEADGSVAVKEVGSANPLVKSSLTRQFQALRFTATGSAEMYSIWLNFNVL